MDKNEGSIIKRGDGRWAGVVSLGFEAGRRIRKTVYGATAAEVQEKLTKLGEDMRRGVPVKTENQTVAQYLDRWLTESVKPSVRPLTFEQYSQHCRLYIEPKLGAIRLAKLSPQHVQAFKNEMLEKKASRDTNRTLSPRTVQLSLVILRHALDQAEKWGLVARNVAKLVDLPRAKRQEAQALTPAQANALLNAAEGERLDAVYAVALALGLRRGEVLGLRWCDVDFDAGTLRVSQALQRKGGKRLGEKSELILVEPKTSKSRRTIPMPERVRLALTAHKARQAQERLQAGSEWRDLGLVFTTGIGSPVEPRFLNEDFNRMLDKAGLGRARLHDLRHSAASFLLAQGVHPRVVMEIIGHSQIGLTMNTYSHVLPDSLQEAANKIDAMLAGA